MKRHDAVLVRVSTDEQGHGGQVGNIETMLVARGVRVPRQHWHIYTVSRSKVSTSPVFQNVMEQVKRGEVSTIYVESRDRFGQTDPGEYYRVLGTLCDNGTRLIALQDGSELTEESFAENVTALMGTHSNKEKLKQTGSQSLRTRINSFKTTGSWPTGPHPYGYGKACRTAGGTLRWVWQPVSRTLGLTYDAKPDGSLRAKPREATPGKIPRKDRSDVIKLVPAASKYVQAVQRVFEFYTQLSLSRRGVSKRLNEEGLTYYDKPFTHSLVTTILKNPAYSGDTHFGKTKAGTYYSFAAGDGQLVEAKGERGGPQAKQPKRWRDEAERLVKEGTHEPLVPPAMWQAAKAKLAADQETTSYAPRNPRYYLRPVLVCGQCGKGMAGRYKDGRVVYTCSTYANARSNGQQSECGAHSILHTDAEAMLLAKAEEMNRQFDDVVNTAAVDNLEQRKRRLAVAHEMFSQDLMRQVREGLDALAGYLAAEHGINYPEIQQLRRLAEDRYFDEAPPEADRLKQWPFDVAGFEAAVAAAEGRAVAEAEAKVAALTRDVERYTLGYIAATGLQRDILRRKADETEAEIEPWQARTVPVSQRIAELWGEERQRREDRQRLMEELPALQYRQRGEAYRRVFQRVELYWDREWRPAKPGAKRKGKYSYTLQHDRTGWNLTTTDLGGGW